MLYHIVSWLIISPYIDISIYRGSTKEKRQMELAKKRRNDDSSTQPTLAAVTEYPSKYSHKHYNKLQ